MFYLNHVVSGKVVWGIQVSKLSKVGQKNTIIHIRLSDNNKELIEVEMRRKGNKIK